MQAPTININDVRTRLRREYNSLNTLTIPRLADGYDSRRKIKNINEQAVYAKHFSVKSPAGNNWIIFMQKSPTVKEYVDKKSIRILAVSYHYGEKGITAFHLTANNGIVGFNAHFFDRYNERMQLNLQHPLHIVKSFFRNGVYCDQAIIKLYGKKQLIAFRVDGLQLGKYHIRNGYIEWRTFVNKNLSFPDQHEVRKKLAKQRLEI